MIIGVLEHSGAKEATKLELNRDLKQCLARHDGSSLALLSFFDVQLAME